MIRNNPFRAARWVGVLILAAAPAGPALGGVVLLSRDSDVRASGASAAGEYQLTNGSGTFDAFTDGLLSDGAAAARSAAQQHSSPTLGADGGLSGATAEGSVRAAVDADVADAFSDAQSDFGLVFRVEDRPALMTFETTLAAAGDAAAAFSIHDAVDGETLPVFSLELADDTQTMRDTALLSPGTYGLSVWAFARGRPGESFAAYTLRVSIHGGDGGAPPTPSPVPLPGAVWGGLAGLSVVGVLVARARRIAARGQ
jgi:hypothetical protein